MNLYAELKPYTKWHVLLCVYSEHWDTKRTATKYDNLFQNPVPKLKLIDGVFGPF